MRDIKTEFLSASFGYFAENGLENMSIRNLCKATGISIGSVYYWFEGKEDLIASTAEYGLRVVLDKLLSHAVNSVNDIDGFFDGFINGVDKYADRIKFISQVVASPLYGEKLRNKVPEHRRMYDRYAEILAETLDCSVEDMKAVVYLMASIVLDYSVWSNRDTISVQLDFMRDTIKKLSAK